MSTTAYPCAAYFWIGVVAVVVSVDDPVFLLLMLLLLLLPLLLRFVGSLRDRWICRSDDPVRIYVPPSEEKVMALIAPVWEEMVVVRVVGSAAVRYVDDPAMAALVVFLSCVSSVSSMLGFVSAALVRCGVCYRDDNVIMDLHDKMRSEVTDDSGLPSRRNHICLRREHNPSNLLRSGGSIIQVQSEAIISSALQMGDSGIDGVAHAALDSLGCGCIAALVSPFHYLLSIIEHCHCHVGVEIAEVCTLYSASIIMSRAWLEKTPLA